MRARRAKAETALEDTFYLTGTVERAPVVGPPDDGGQLVLLVLTTEPVHAGGGRQRVVVVWPQAREVPALGVGDRVLVHGAPPVRLCDSAAVEAPPVLELTAVGVERLAAPGDGRGDGELRRRVFDALRARSPWHGHRRHSHG